MSSLLLKYNRADIRRVEPLLVGRYEKSCIAGDGYGKDIANCKVTIDYPGVQLDEVVQVDNPNYLSFIFR